MIVRNRVFHFNFQKLAKGGLSKSLIRLKSTMPTGHGAPTGFMSSGGILSEGYGHIGPGVCLGDGQTEAEGVPSHGGRGDALLRRMPPYLTLT